MIATHSKMGGSYHALVLASEYTIPTSYIRNMQFSAGLTFPYTQLDTSKFVTACTAHTQ